MNLVNHPTKSRTCFQEARLFGDAMASDERETRHVRSARQHSRAGGRLYLSAPLYLALLAFYRTGVRSEKSEELTFSQERRAKTRFI